MKFADGAGGMRQDNLKNRTISALTWSGFETATRRTAQFIIGVALARLLAPEEFGIIAMLLVFTGIADAFVDSGFSSALIQKKNLAPEDASSVFYFNLALGSLMGLLLCVAAPWIAAFYGIPSLEPLTYLMALNLILGSLGSVHAALLIRDLDFRTQTRITFVATMVSGSVALVMALYGWGIWSLASQTLSLTMVSTALLWFWRPWRPAPVFQLSSLISLFRFGSYLLFAGLVEVIFGRLNTLLIGKLYSARDLGFYARADNTQRLPAQIMSTVINKVAFPVFSAASSEQEVLVQGVKKSISGLMMVNLPISLGMLAVAHPLILTLFGEKWEPCVPYVQILCLAGMFWPLHVINLSALKGQGRSDLFFRVEILKKVLGIVIVLVTCSISVLAMAWGQVVIGIMSFVINSHYTGLLLGYPTMSQIRDLLPYCSAALVMVASVWPLSQFSYPHPVLQLLSQVGVGAIIYGTICGAFKLPAFCEALALIKSSVLKRKHALGD